MASSIIGNRGPHLLAMIPEREANPLGSRMPRTGGTLTGHPRCGPTISSVNDPDPLKDACRGPRLQKVLAAAGLGPRRACEAMIESGAVSVNGRTVRKLPVWVDPSRDRITVGGRPVKTSPRHVHVMLYKPRGVVSTNADPAGRPRAIDLVDHPTGVRLYAAGRLDMDSTGLLLMTNDGELANRITHPRFHLPKTYEVTVRGLLDADGVRRLTEGLFLPRHTGSRGRKTGRCHIRLIRRDRDGTRLLIELREGRNRQIRRMLQRLGHPVKKLRRIQLGPLKLKGLRPGQWRALTPQELRALKRAAAQEGKDSPPRRRERRTLKP